MPKAVPLSQGKFAIVDDADFDWLSQWKWSAQKAPHGFYAMRRCRGKLILMHRLILGTPDMALTDHIDGDGLNNQRCNLRPCSALQNMMNRRGKRNGTSKFKGVWADNGPRNTKPWRAAIRINGKLQYLGRFHTEQAAGDAYADAAARYFGEFARSNAGGNP